MEKLPDEHDKISEYELHVKRGVIDAQPYDRLMIHYRKAKEYQNELRTVDAGLAAFQKHNKKQQEEMFKGTKTRASIKKISDKISRSSGLSDTNGKPLYTPEPIARWLKRKATIVAKINKQKATGKK